MVRRPTSRSLSILMLGCVIGLLLAAGPAVAANGKVSIVDLAFDPPTVTIDQGDVVTWTNTGATGHTVTAADGSFDSGTLSPGDDFANLFETAGTFTYHCTIHSSMQGTVVVRAVAATPVSSDITPPPGTIPPGLITPTPTDAGYPRDTGSGASPVVAVVAIVLVLALLGVIAYRLRRRR